MASMSGHENQKQVDLCNTTIKTSCDSTTFQESIFYKGLNKTFTIIQPQGSFRGFHKPILFIFVVEDALSVEDYLIWTTLAVHLSQQINCETSFRNTLSVQMVLFHGSC
ncbi:hypothetical protein PR048_013709, partial [Dryococelus australis]